MKPNRFLRNQIVLLMLCYSSIINGREYVRLDQATCEQATWQKTGVLKSVACSYMSVDQHQQPILLSGRLFVPIDAAPEYVVLCPHYTITGNSECPSETVPQEAQALSNKPCVIICPDYLGYGVTVAQEHPYLDVHLTVRNTLDMLQAAKEYCKRNNIVAKTDSIVIVGFSQGAAVALGALQEIERTGMCPVKKCFASSGPYDVATLYDLSVARNYIGMAFVVPAFVIGTSTAYGIPIHPDTLFTPWMQKRYRYAISKEHGTIATALRLWKGPLDKYMSAAGMDKTRGEQKLLYEGYLRSSLVHIYAGDTIMNTWCPRTPIYLMHSTSDDLVGIECAENMRTLFQHNGATCVTYDFGDYGGHVKSMLRFLKMLRSLSIN